MRRRGSRTATPETARQRLKPLVITILLVLGLAACAPGGERASPTPGDQATAQPSPLSSPAGGQATPTQATLPQATQPGVENTRAPEASPNATSVAATSAATSATASAATPTQPETGNAAQLPDPGGYTWQAVASGFDSPVGLANAGDGNRRLFVLEQAGRIRVIQDGQVVQEPFLDITDRVGSQANEQGLLGLAFHPRFPENGYFYVNYTDKNGNTVISRFSVAADPNRADPNKADPGSEKVLLRVDQPYANHNGGATVFGPDGYLYLGLGDGGSAGDPHGNGQSLETLLGKILRIDIDQGDPYAIPADNPFASGGGKPEIWAYGLRNPWRFTFDRASGDLYIGDVGQNQWEEVDFLPAGSPGGENFGWNIREGAHPYEGGASASANLVEPVAEYDHSQGCSITGGYVYRGQVLPEFQGIYLYGDFCSGTVWGLLKDSGGSWQNAQLFSTGASITSFGEDESGEIYLVDRSGTIFQLVKK